MTWPFENDTSAIVKKLAGRSMQADKRNKAFLLLTIAISVCMVFSILLISTGTQEKFKNTQRNKAQIGILGVTDEQTAQLRQNGNITWVGEYSALGVFYVENKTITVAYGNEDYFLHQEEITFQGSVPQKADEIMLPQNYLDFLGKSYQAGDTISIDLTGTGQEAEYTLSGVLNNTKESNGYFIYVSKELARDLAKDSFQVTAYTRLNTDAISSTAILDLPASNTKYRHCRGTGNAYRIFCCYVGCDNIGYSDSSTTTGGVDSYFGGNDCLWCFLHKDCKKCSDVWATADSWHDKKAD
ncbi:ABC transporter permease [Blautia sp. OF11-22]|uniref:ABC transporter permease n=1 Tax=Blautia sp. OF11-22 TaxID=2292982 RepID=UPI001FAA9F2E|nr:ABC transporter permease [Blautia sp. OF11-22]